MKAIIIDDESLQRETMEVFLREYCPQVKLVATAENGETGLSKIKKHRPDIIFLDIDMPDMSGFELLKKLGPTTILVIFVTAFHKFAETAFEFAALDFLRKPVEPTRLIKAVHRAGQQLQLHHLQEQYSILLDMMNQALPVTDQRMHPIVFSTRSEMLFKKVGMIVYIEAQGNACKIKLTDEIEAIHIYKTMREYELHFESFPFIMRVQHSFMVNLYHVKKFIREEFVLIMTDGAMVSLSENKRSECLERLMTLGLSTD